MYPHTGREQSNVGLLFFKTGQFVWQAGRQQAPIKRKHKSTSVYSLFKGAFSVWTEETESGDVTHSSLLLIQEPFIQ